MSIWSVFFLLTFSPIYACVSRMTIVDFFHIAHRSLTYSLVIRMGTHPRTNPPALTRRKATWIAHLFSSREHGSRLEQAGAKITVQIIDSCPARNYCKALGPNPEPAQERCGDGSTNYLDIDYHAYEHLTGGTLWGSVMKDFRRCALGSLC